MLWLINKLTLLKALVLFILSIPSFADDLVPKISVVRDYLSGGERSGFSGAVLVARGEKILLGEGYGFSDRGKKIANTPKTLFSIGSVSKQFTAAAILTLVDQRKLNLSDPLKKFFKALPSDKADITIHQLLTHSSGFEENFGDSDFDYMKTDGFFSGLFSTQLQYKPGAEHRYSNAGYSILARVIELVSGRDYETYLSQTIFEPANMQHTGYLIPQWKNIEVAKGYAAGVLETQTLVSRYQKVGAVAWPLKGNGGIHSTLEDMHRWYLALSTGAILSKASAQLLTTPFIKECDDCDSHYAYGWAIFNTGRNTKRVTHNGGNGIYFFDFHWLPEEDVVVIYATNAMTPNVEDIAWSVEAMLFDPAFKPEEIQESLVAKIVDAASNFPGTNDELIAHIKTGFKAKIKSDFELSEAGYFFYMNGMYDKAIALNRLNLQLYPDNGQLWVNHGIVYFESGDLESAKTCFEKSLVLKVGDDCEWCGFAQDRLLDIASQTETAQH